MPGAATSAKTASGRRSAGSWLTDGRVVRDVLAGGRFSWLVGLIVGAPWLVVCLVSLGVVVGIGYLDVTLGDLSLSAVYLIPIASATAGAGRAAGMIAAAAAAATWTTSDAITEHGRRLAVTLTNGGAFLLLFVSASLLLAALNDALKRAQALARTDPLTGAANRRSLEDRFEIERYRSTRILQPLTLVYLDIDGFKRVNDRQGHAAGDAAIRAVCRALTSVTRQGDVVARLGGDEFVLLLLDTDDAEARLVADRILAFPITDASGTAVTLSLGVVTCIGVPPLLEDHLGAADAAMYEAKRQGGNRAAFHILVGLAGADAADSAAPPTPSASIPKGA